MKSETMSPTKIRKLGLEVLAKALGPVGMVRFLQQFDTGVGDYTKERAKWLRELDIEMIVKEIKGRRKTKCTQAKRWHVRPTRVESGDGDRGM